MAAQKYNPFGAKALRGPDWAPGDPEDIVRAPQVLRETSPSDQAKRTAVGSMVLKSADTAPQAPEAGDQ